MTPRHTIRITNDIQRPTKRNTMLATSATIKWPFPRNSSKHGTPSSMTRGTTSGIPKNKVQQTRLLHLAKGRKVICDAVGIYYATTTGNTEAAAEWVKDLVQPELQQRQDDDEHDGAHARHARARFSPTRYGTRIP
jgi:hypothetical protein